MIKKTIFSALIFCALFFIFPCLGEMAVVKGDSDKLYTLKLNLKKGFTWKYKNEGFIEQISETSMGSMTFNINSSSESSYEIKDVISDGKCITEMTFGKINYSMGRSTDPKLYQIKELVGKKLQFIHNSAGELEEISSEDDLSFKIEGQESNAKDNPGDLFINFPDKPVKIGDSWTAVIKPVKGQTGDRKVDGSITYTLLGEKKKKGIPTAKISAEGKLTLSGSQNIMGQFVEFAGTTEIKSELYVSLETGMTVESKIKAKSDVDAYAGGSDVNVTINSETKIKASFKK